MSDGLRVTIQVADEQHELPSLVDLEKWVRSGLGGACGEVTLRVVSAAESAQLNTRYRGRSGPTNVLAFPAQPGLPAAADELAPLGDLAVCAAIVVSEAKQQGKMAVAHWAHVVVHGALHLAGYDHEREAEAKVMEARERMLLAELGVADPYAAD